MLKNSDTHRDHLTAPEAADHSGFIRTYLTLLLRRDTLVGFRHGRDWFVYTDSLEALLAMPRKSGPRGLGTPPRSTISSDEYASFSFRGE